MAKDKITSNFLKVSQKQSDIVDLNFSSPLTWLLIICWQPLASDRRMHMSHNMHSTMYVLCYEITDRVFGDTKMDEGLE